MNDSLFSEPEVTVIMKCISCGETLLYGRKECQYCGQIVDPDYAIRSAIYNTTITRACSWANTIQSSANIAMAVCAVSFGIGLLNGRSQLTIALLLSISYTIPVGMWCYKYGDTKIHDGE